MIINLTLHTPTPEQTKQGVVDLDEPYRSILKDNLNVTELPTKSDIKLRVTNIINCILHLKEGTMVMVGGATFIIPELVKRLKEMGLKPVCPFTKRVLKEVQNPDGTVSQERVLKFEGWVEL